jgi:hypothetical protein
MRPIETGTGVLLVKHEVKVEALGTNNSEQ